MIGIKNILKSFGSTIVVFCAAFITYLFQSFRLDLNKLNVNDLSELQKSLYNAQITQSNIMLAITGGVLGSFAVITLFFSISRYIKENQANMGILKAMGYERKKIAIAFTKFAINALLASLLAILIGALLQSTFYKEMSNNQILLNISMSFHPILSLIILILPALVFTGFAYLIAYLKLSRKPLDMIKGSKNKKAKMIKEKKTFLKTLKSTVFKNHISLVIFVGFASLCFGASVQMSFSLDQLDTSPFFFWMMLIIGILLGVTILYLAFSFTYSENKEYVSLMKGYGYSDVEIIKVLYGGYIYVTVIGFAVGTVYQYGLFQLLLNVFAETTDISFSFSFAGLGYTLLIFVPTYLLINVYFYYKLQRLSIKDALLAE